MKTMIGLLTRNDALTSAGRSDRAEALVHHSLGRRGSRR
ncbi:hypothetical protein PB2503_10074 [Parvularcula bermudensis HTCC2503]|uniref:Uncharacterized protein n=2 Tax=Parvularcula TaxID=208215 RepID=E0TEX4_PARBH|nr:hypothetical protein PB2503_10074 [Parvularcula bermudensis HTCC2503]